MFRFALLFIFICIASFGQSEDKQPNAEKKVIIEKGRQAFFSKNLPELQKITLQIDSLYKQTNDSILLAKYYHFKALEHKLTYTVDSAFLYYYKSKEISKKLKDSLAVGRRLLSIAVLQRKVRDYLGSEISSIEGLEYLEYIDKKNKDVIIYIERIYNNLGLVSEELSRKKEAIYYYYKALELNKISNNKDNYLLIHNNLGVLYQRRNEQEQAIKFFLKALNFGEIKGKYPRKYALLLENLTCSQFKMGEDILVIERYKEVLNLRIKHKLDSQLATTYLNFAAFYNKKKDFKKVIRYLKKSLFFSEKTHNNKRWLEALQLLSKLTTDKESNKYLQEYIQLNDSLFLEERRLKNQFARIRYETDKKEKENVALKSENEKIAIEILKQKQQKTISWFLAIISLLGLGVSILFYILKKRKLLYKSQLQKAQATFEERDRIAQELHDGVLGKLFGTRFSLGFLKITGNEQEQEKYIELLNELQDIEKEIRDVSHALSHTIKSNSESYELILRELIEQKSRIANFSYNVSIGSEVVWEQIKEKDKAQLYRIIQEALQNIVKHAKAKHVVLTIYLKEKQLYISVKDNGIGFDITKSVEGIGVKNMKTRIKKLKGTIRMSSKPGEGATIQMHFPI